MFGFRFFRTLGLAFCICALNWGQAHVANAGAPDVRLVAAANVTLEKNKKGPHENKTSNTRSNASKAGKQTKSAVEHMKPQDGKSASTKATRPARKEKPAVRSVVTTPRSKTAAKVSGKGKRREPLPPASPDMPQNGIASWIGKSFHGKPVSARGELHDMASFTAAHRAVPLNSILKVTDLSNGRSILVRVNDRGPYIRGRTIDLSKGAAEYLGFAGKGLTTVRMELAGSDNDPAQRYYIRMRPSKDPGKTSPVQGFGPFNKFDEAVSLFASLYKSYPNAELMAVREKG